MNNNSRRKFLKNTALAGLSFAVPNIIKANTFFPNQDNLSLTILHTNDVHSQLDPFPMDGSSNAGLGGVAVRKQVIDTIRNQTANVLLFDAGDMFQGTPYFNIYKGEPEIKAMSLMGYDAGTIGNHDFDGGLENLANQLKHANFPILNCNYAVEGTALQSKILPYKIFEKGDIKIGVLGVGIELQGLVPEVLCTNVLYQNPVEKANETAEYLKKQGCHFIVCLSHLGDKYIYDKVSDETLARQSFDIDLIIGGHTHKLFKEPRVYSNKNGEEVIVNQMGFGGIALGKLEYNFSKSLTKKRVKHHTVVLGKKTN